MNKQLSIVECAKLAGVSRTTIYAKMNSGELSKLNNKKVEISELLRVFPNIVIQNQSNENNMSTEQSEVSTSVHSVDESALLVEIKYLKKEVESLEKQIIAKDLDIDRLNLQADRLMSTNERLQLYALPDPNKKPHWKFWG